MRTRQSLIAALTLAGLVGAFLFTAGTGVTPASADHHLMRIDRVMSNGDVQYVQLRMYSAGQTNLTGKQLCFYDAAGNAAGSFTFGGTVTNGATDATILIGTAEFDTAWTGGSPDFLFSDHPVPQPAGKVEFRLTCAGTLYDAVAYGSGYTGSAGFGAKFPNDLPAADQALRLDPNAPDTSGSRNNSIDYSLGAADFKKNNGTTGTLGATDTPTASPTVTASPTTTATATATPIPTVTPTPTATLTPCPTVSPTNCDIITNPPSSTGTTTPTATPTITFTAPPTSPGGGEQRTWGDNNCSDDPPDPVDGLLALRFDAGLSTNTGDCPPMGEVVEVGNASPHPWGDIDCSGEVNPVDSLKLLRFDAGLDVAQADGCPELGETVAVT